MAQGVKIKLDDGTGKEYERMLKTSFLDSENPGEGITIVSKTDGTSNGLPIVGIHSYAVIPNPPHEQQEFPASIPVMAVMTGKLFIMAAVALMGAHPSLKDEFEKMFQMPDVGQFAPIEGKHQGVGYTAIPFAGYVITVEGAKEVSLHAGMEPGAAKLTAEQAVKNFLENK